MSRIVLSTNQSWFHQVTDKYESNFTKCIDLNECKVKAASFKKLNVNNCNSFVCGDDYIITSGTLIYKGLFGREGLEQLFFDAKSYSVKELRKNLIGSYAVGLKKGDKIFVFVDETHTYSLYYYSSDKGILITNSYCHIGEICKADINSPALLELGVRRCTMGNATPFQNVFKLSATEIINININSGVHSIDKIELNNYSRIFNAKEEAVNALYEAIKDISAIRSKYLKNVHHFLTGGIDSRLELAIHLYNNDNVSVGYWMGKDLLTNGTKEDLSIVSKIAEDFGLRFSLYDVAEDIVESLNSIDRKKYNIYGEHSSTYAGNKKLFSIFSANEVDYIGFGYLGETIRALSDLDNAYKDDFSVSEFVREVYCRTGLEREIFVFNGFYDYLEEELSSLMDYTNCCVFNKDAAFKLFSFSRFEADCSMSNFSNLFSYSFPIFGQKRIADIVMSLKYEWLAGDEIPVKLIELFQPMLLKYPIYSHHRSFTYNKRKSKLNKNLKFKVLDTLKRELKNTFIYKMLYVKYLHSVIRPQTKGNEDIANKCFGILKQLKVLERCQFKMNSGSWNGVDIGTIATFAADLKALNCALEGRENV